MKRNTILQIIIAAVLLTLLVGCTSLNPLPKGVTLLRGVDPNHFESPLWSPDGLKIIGDHVVLPMYFMGIFGSNPVAEIYLIDASNGKSRLILKEKDGRFWVDGWTQDSQAIIIVSEISSFGKGCFSFNLQEATPTLIADDVCREDLSPDKKKSVYFEWRYPYEQLKLIIGDEQSGENEMVYSISTKGVWFANRSSPEWSPDMEKIVFSLGMQMERDKPADTDIYIFDVETRNLEKFVNDPVYFESYPAFSPDGKFIAYFISGFAKDTRTERGVIITRVDKSCEWRLPFGGSFDWSPDSTKLVVSADDGVYIVDLPVFLGESFVNESGCP